jgi:hypothetical protein
MKNIRYTVIFDDNQHPLYICDLELIKIIDVQPRIINFKFHITTPIVKFYD